MLSYDSNDDYKDRNASFLSVICNTDSSLQCLSIQNAVLSKPSGELCIMKCHSDLVTYLILCTYICAVAAELDTWIKPVPDELCRSKPLPR